MASVDAKKLVVASAGVILVYSGLKGKSLSTTFRDLLTGKNPANDAQATPITPSASTTGSGASGPSLPGSVGGVSKGNLSNTTRITKSWASAVLKALGAPLTSANYDFLFAWAKREGGGGLNNPFNTTLPMPGSTSLAGNSAGVQNYTSAAQGALATVRTLLGGGYSDIVAALRSGHISLTQNYAGLSTWSGGGYSNLAGITP